jgi:hypothetical protein
LAARGVTVDDAQRYALLREVASGLGFLHNHGVCVGDISPKNLLFALAPPEVVYFIDCDAMRINGVSALPQVETPGWEVPAGEELATIYSDNYKLGLLALRRLAGDQDTENLQYLPAATPVMLRQIIIDTLTNPPAQRPLPEAWTFVLRHAIEDAQHRVKTAAPVPAPLPAPAVPIVHSRPTTSPPTERPKKSAPASKPTAAQAKPAARPATIPPTRGTRTSSKVKIWGPPAAAALAVVVAIVVVAVRSATNAPVKEAALPGLLLSPDQLNSTLSTTGVTAGGIETTMDTGASVSDEACRPLDGAAEAPAYATSGWSAMRGQPATNHQSVAVDQNVVLFPAAGKASAFYAASAEGWAACAGKTYTATTSDTHAVVAVGAISDDNGTLSYSYTTTVGGAAPLSGQRALVVANNVVVDVWALSHTPSGAAVAVAHQIAAKVTAMQ